MNWDAKRVQKRNTNVMYQSRPTKLNTPTPNIKNTYHSQSKASLEKSEQEQKARKRKVFVLLVQIR